jgi:hypothetical protein
MHCVFEIGVSLKKARAFAAMALKKKSHGSSFDLPMAVLVCFLTYQILFSEGQTNAK